MRASSRMLLELRHPPGVHSTPPLRCRRYVTDRARNEELNRAREVIPAPRITPIRLQNSGFPLPLRLVRHVPDDRDRTSQREISWGCPASSTGKLGHVGPTVE